MAVLLSKPPCRSETVNDLHGDLVNLARVIQDPALGPRLYRRLRRVWSSEAEFRAALAIVRAADGPACEPDIDRAFYYFISSWQGMNGIAGTARGNTIFCRRFTSAGGDASARWRAAVRSIPAWRKRLANVSILSSDGIGLCLKIEDRPGTAIYADPPYLVKGARYQHDFAHIDHARLAAALNRFRATRVVVSYYDHPDLEGLYPGWHVARHDLTKSLVSPGKRGHGHDVRAPEVLLCNQPFAAPDLFGGDAA